MQVGSKRNFFMGQLNLPVANTPYNVVALINAVIQAESPTSTQQMISGDCRINYIESHNGIDNVGANTNDILLGESIVAGQSLLTGARYGRVIPKAGAGFTFQGTFNNVDFGNYWVQSAGTNQKINVIVSNG